MLQDFLSVLLFRLGGGVLLTLEYQRKDNHAGIDLINGTGIFEELVATMIVD